MKKILFMLIAVVGVFSLCSCHKNNPQTMWASDVDTTLKVPPVNTGGTSKTAPYERCNYGEDCSRKNSTNAATSAPVMGDDSRSITVSETGPDGVTHSRTMTITPDGNGGGSIVFSGDED